MIVKVHSSNDKKIVAVCDKELLGKKFEEKDLQIDLTSEFFNGSEMSNEELERELRGVYVANFVGEESVRFAVKRKIVNKDKVVVIANVQTAQAMMF